MSCVACLYRLQQRAMSRALQVSIALVLPLSARPMRKPLRRAVVAGRIRGRAERRAAVYNLCKTAAEGIYLKATLSCSLSAAPVRHLRL
jgi:hypothetical protein